MSRMSTPYEQGGYENLKRRTREALVSAARELIAAGANPRVEEAAAAAGVSRTTAYRYFPNQAAMLVAAHPEMGAVSLLDSSVPTDPETRLDAVIDRFLDIIVSTELQQRTMLRLSLDPDPDRRGQLPLRQGRAIGWIEEALEPLRDDLGSQGIHSLALAIRSAAGIEALVWLTDVGGLSRQAAVETMKWSARAMLQAASTGDGPVSRAE